MITLNNISKCYIRGKQLELVLDQVNLHIPQGSMVGIRGKSGSGKSTLLNILSSSLKADSGSMIFQNMDMQKTTSKQQSNYRRTCIGYIPQNLYLLEDRDVYHNIALPLQYNKIKRSKIKEEIHLLSDKFGIKHLLDKDITTLSGGEKQRIAICRALIKKPKMILADEPTGSLDDENEDLVIRMLQLMKEQGSAIVIATHYDKVSDVCDTVYHIKDGKLAYQ